LSQLLPGRAFAAIAPQSTAAVRSRRPPKTTDTSFRSIATAPQVPFAGRPSLACEKAFDAQAHFLG
jgi:hypothetical protein